MLDATDWVVVGLVSTNQPIIIIIMTSQVGITPPLLIGLLPFFLPRPTVSQLLLADHHLPLLPTASTLALSTFSVVAVFAEVDILSLSITS